MSFIDNSRWTFLTWRSHVAILVALVMWNKDAAIISIYFGAIFMLRLVLGIGWIVLGVRAQFGRMGQWAFKTARRIWTSECRQCDVFDVTYIDGAPASGKSTLLAALALRPTSQARIVTSGDLAHSEAAKLDGSQPSVLKALVAISAQRRGGLLQAIHTGLGTTHYLDDSMLGARVLVFSAYVQGRISFADLELLLTTMENGGLLAHCSLTSRVRAEWPAARVQIIMATAPADVLTARLYTSTEHPSRDSSKSTNSLSVEYLSLIDAVTAMFVAVLRESKKNDRREFSVRYYASDSHEAPQRHTLRCFCSVTTTNPPARNVHLLDCSSADRFNQACSLFGVPNKLARNFCARSPKK